MNVEVFAVFSAKQVLGIDAELNLTFIIEAALLKSSQVTNHQ
jgi:hypothetical protein